LSQGYFKKEAEREDVIFSGGVSKPGVLTACDISFFFKVKYVCEIIEV